MESRENKIKQLEEQVNRLQQQQSNFAQNINAITREIQALKAESTQAIQNSIKPNNKEETTPTKAHDSSVTPTSSFKFKLPEEPSAEDPQQKSPTNLEEFIGGNILSKVGILITIIGVAIGVKYSIDNNLISPVIRVLIGYIFGLSIIGLAFKLKSKYFAYSAVLLSGAVTMLYFITFFSYSVYQLFPQILAFLIMVSITVFTIFSALNYNRQIIAQLGLVGAYAIPFLLSDGSGRIGILLFYITLINLGILAVSYFKNWKSLIYSSFALSWLILSAWLVTDFSYTEHFTTGFIYNIVFFVTFYSIVLANEFIDKQSFSPNNAALLLLNSFLFYALGMLMLYEGDLIDDYGGLFTLINAFFHALVASIVYQKKLVQQHLFYFIIALSIAFITLTIPVQLDGKWITLLWAIEAALLFIFGRIRRISPLEHFSYPLIFIVFTSLLNLWANYNDYYSISHPEDKIALLFNPLFLTTCFSIFGFGVINFIWQKHKINPPKNPFQQLMSYVIPGLFIFITYMSFRLEIDNYWHQLYIDSTIETADEWSGNLKRNKDLLYFSSIWIINYSLLFFGALSIFNFVKLKNQILYSISALLNLAILLIFMGKGLYDISELRASYLDVNSLYSSSYFHIVIRYLSYPFVLFSLYALSQLVKSRKLIKDARVYFDLLLAVVAVWILSSESIGLLNLAAFNNSYKLGLSILWGISSLTLISIGIFQQKKHLRIAAIALFGITLIKLFFYDISHIGTIQKTVVFVSLGILLLIISFLYNKFKDNINK